MKHPDISIHRQCQLLSISRSSVYYHPRTERERRDVDELIAIRNILETMPFYGYRKVSRELIKRGTQTTRKRVRRIMKKFGLMAIYPKPNLSGARKEHTKYPYLLAGKIIRHPNQVWASDITYIKLPGGHVYVVAIIDLYSRKVLTWKLSNSLSVDFCIQAPCEALDKYGSPSIFNTDQGSQFTSEEFTNVLKKNHIRIRETLKNSLL